MKAQLWDPDDLNALRRRLASEVVALQRDRTRAVLLAIQGIDQTELTREQIAQTLGRSRQFVDEWVKRYRQQGLAGIEPRKAKGNPPSLTVEQQAAFKTRLLAGPTDADEGVCTLRGKEAQRILGAEFGVHLKLSAVYNWMHRVNLSCLKPRPRHRKNDPAAMQQWLDDAPLLSSK